MKLFAEIRCTDFCAKMNDLSYRNIIQFHISYSYVAHKGRVVKIWRIYDSVMPEGEKHWGCH